MNRSILALAAIALIAPALAFADPATKPAANADGGYPIAVDIVSGEALPTGDALVVEQIDGREVRFASKANVEKFKAEGEAMHKKLDDAIVAAQKEGYKLDTCAVSDEKLESMGKPIMYVDRASNTLIELCCKSCVRSVKKDPTEALEKVKAANAKG